MVDSAAVVQALPRMDAVRFRQYSQHLRFYDGEQWTGRPRRNERRLVFNYTRTLIEKAAAFTLSGMKSVIEGEENGDDDPPALIALRQVYEDNDVSGLDFDAEVDCSVLGDGCFRVTWDVETKRVLVSSPDVQGIYVWPWPGDLARIWRLAHRYEWSDEEYELMRSAAPAAQTPAAPAGDGLQRAGRAPAKRHKVVELWTEALFELFVDGVLVEAKPNPYGFIPYVVYPNVRVPKQFWGESDITAVSESQRELNRAMTQLSKIMELSGSPIAVLENVTQQADIAVEPGAVWTLPEASKAYLLDLLAHGGVGLHKDFVDLIYRTLHDVGESPRVSFGEADAAVSGIAMELQMDPLVKKVERKRRVREVAFRKRDEMVLRLLTMFKGEQYSPFRTRIVWGQLLPTDRARAVQDEVAMVAAGVHSRRTAARNLGSDDAEAEFAQWQAEQKAIGAMSPKAEPGEPAQ